MIDLGVLDNVIGVVVVILLLSMVVQSLQTFVKKLSKFKSRQIEKSLQRLFEKTAASAPATGAATADSVLEHFRALGRVTALNRHAVESISKADLSKVVASIEGATLLPDKVKEPVTSFLTSVEQVQQAIETLANIQLPPDATGKVTELRQKLAPLATQVAQLVDASGKLRAELIVRDVIAMRDFPSADVVKLVAELQTLVQQTAAANPGNAVLQQAAASARTLANAVTDLHARFTGVIGKLRERIDAIETWYDTVMQGFEERYARHMRTWAFIISIVVAVVMNADLAQVYKRMATDDLSKQIVMGEVQRRQAALKAQPLPEGQTLQDATRQLNEELDDALNAYPAMGLEPLDVGEFLAMKTGEQARAVFGWILMAFLLSLGAPFWHDTLESLFGLKNLLRSKTETQNVEQRSGEGQTKS